ncbi:hypothetical protein V8F20_004683 [Naviculisporaceae sp. PSN 640]
MAAPTHSWPGSAGHAQQQHHQQHPQQHQMQQTQHQQHQQGHDDMGLQTRPMGLKVHYTFDREGQVNCLARWPHIIPIQTMPLDELNTIGVIDLRTCLHAIAQCSPEIVNQHETDYSVYAFDYSEPDTPLVGQGMLSTRLEPSNEQQQQLVTGRVTRSLLAILSNGSRETLEVKMKLTAVARMQQRSDFSQMDVLNMSKLAPNPADAASSEWNSFIQSNPMLGHSGNIAPVPSPALPPSRLNTATSENRTAEARPEYPQYMTEDMAVETNIQDYCQYQPMRPASIPPTLAPAPQAPPPSSNPPPPMADGPRPGAPVENAPSPAPLPTIENAVERQPAPGSRPASRASRRNRPPTGRPRGRPRKNPLETGNTSAAEEPTTDGDDGPQKKRVKITKAEYNAATPFGSTSESLRVTASTSGSLRNMRPVGAGGSEVAVIQGQDVPRAPTPVPDMSRLPKHHMKRAFEKSKSEAAMDSESGLPYQSRFSQPIMQRSMSMGMDGQSPAESAAQSPDPGYTPEDSPPDIGSSPPVPRARSYMRTSPVASSPLLPPMPLPQVDSGFMSGGIDDFFDDDQMLQDLPQEQGQELPKRTDLQPKQPPPAKTSKPNGQKPARPQPKQPNNFHFKKVNPGPPELLPVTNIYKPSCHAKSFHRADMMAAEMVAQEQRHNPELKRAATDPSSIMSERQDPAQHRSISQQPFLEVRQDGDDIQMSEAPAPPPPELDQQSQFPSFPNTQQPPLDGLPTAPNSQAFFELAPGLDNSLERVHGAVESAIAAVPKERSVEPAVKHTENLPVPERPVPERPVPERPVPETVLTLPSLASESVAKPAPSLPVVAVPASDPVPETTSILPQPFMSEAACPPTDAADPAETAEAEEERYSRNLFKKQAIKERLETAVQKGVMPPFCNNCGAIETPTWRKIWTQEHQGVPEFHEFSDKPGMVTMVDILSRDADGKPTSHLLVKKNLGPKDKKQQWKESLLCNPCGIWLTKFKSHRPPERWDKDASRLNQPRKKKNRSKKPRTKSDAQMNPTSEAYFPTDPIGPADRDSPKLDSFESGMGGSRRPSVVAIDDGNEQVTALNDELLNSNRSPKQSRPGSTHSRGSGTADSPIAVEDDLGTTRRLLFPSPRKEGVPKVLGELAVNFVQTTTIIQEVKSAGTGKENKHLSVPEAQMRSVTPTTEDRDSLDQELFGTPPRPSTPPPKSGPGPFKTPTRATPSHRPVTRSISRSIAKSPGQALFQLQRTPSRTPRSTRANTMGLLAGVANSGSGTKRRSDRHAHFALDEDLLHTTARFAGDISPFSASLRDLLSEANDFTVGSPSHGFPDLDLSTMPNIDSDDHHMFDVNLANLLSTEMMMPSSPPLTRNHTAATSAGAAAESLWAQISAPGAEVSHKHEKKN